MQDATVTMPEIHLPKINVRPSAGQNLRMAWVWMRYIHRYHRTSFFSYISSRKNSTISTFFVLSIRMLAACNVWTRPTHPTTNGFPFSGTPSSRFVMNFSAAPCPTCQPQMILTWFSQVGRHILQKFRQEFSCGWAGAVFRGKIKQGRIVDSLPSQ